MFKIFKWFILLGIVAIISWAGFKWYRASSISVEAFNLIPSDAIFCITTEDPIASWKDIAGSAAWNHLQANSYFASLTSSANKLDSLIHENDLLFELIGSRSLIVSAHMTGSKEYDFLFLVELNEASGIKFLNDYLTNFSTAGFSIRKESYAGKDIISLHDLSEKKNLYVTLPGTYLLASYTKEIITSALDSHAQHANDTLETNSMPEKETIVNTREVLESNGLFKLYINYERLPQFMRCYTSGTNEYAIRLSQILQTTDLNFTLEEEMIKATGHTYLNDSVESYLKTLSSSGRAPSEFTEIAPQRTAFALGLGFSSFGEFFENFEMNLRQDIGEYNRYRETLEQAEDYLKINLQENFIDWIGEEVALLELQSYGKGLDSETALVLKADNIEKARRNLGYIEKMVRKKTPVKFKEVSHQGYTISYLSMKGMFKILFGKFFARFDKPYYTIINNFVIFSNHPQTLKSIIDDYLDKETLTRSAEFRSFRKTFDDEGSVFIYLNTPVLFNTMKKLADDATQVSMERNKEYITCFRHVGFQLVPETRGFKTTFAEQFTTPEPQAFTVFENTKTIDSLWQVEKVNVDAGTSAEGSDPMALPYIYAQNLNASSYSFFFPDSTVHYTVDLKNGFKDGNFTEYYSSGELKMRGSFKNDKRDGTWRLYDESGKLMMRRNYENGEIKKEKSKD